MSNKRRIEGYTLEMVGFCDGEREEETSASRNHGLETVKTIVMTIVDCVEYVDGKYKIRVGMIFKTRIRWWSCHVW